MVWRLVLRGHDDEIERRNKTLGRTKYREPRASAGLPLHPQRGHCRATADRQDQVRPRWRERGGSPPVDVIEKRQKPGFTTPERLPERKLLFLHGPRQRCSDCAYLRVVAELVTDDGPDTSALTQYHRSPRANAAVYAMTRPVPRRGEYNPGTSAAGCRARRARAPCVTIAMDAAGAQRRKRRSSHCREPGPGMRSQHCERKNEEFRHG